MINDPQDALGGRVLHRMVYCRRGVERDEACAVDADADDGPYGGLRCGQHDQDRNGHERQKQADAVRQRVGEFVHRADYRHVVWRRM